MVSNKLVLGVDGIYFHDDLLLNFMIPPILNFPFELQRTNNIQRSPTST